MKCEHCGKSISILSNFCEHCGKPVKPFIQRFVAFLKILFDKSVKLCKKNKWLLPSVVGVIAVLFVVTSIANHKRELDFTDYVTFDVVGYNEQGTLNVKFDFDKLANDVLGKEPNQESKKSYEKYIKYENQKEELSHLFFADVDRCDNLKNGDFFLASVYVENAPVFAENKIAVKNEPYTKTFEIGADTDKLPNIAEIDLFNYILVDFAGENDYGEASVSQDEIVIDLSEINGDSRTLTLHYTTSYWNGTYFDVTSSRETDGFATIDINIDNSRNLSNGDITTVELEFDEDALIEQLGIKLLASEKEYTVSGLEVIEEIVEIKELEEVEETESTEQTEDFENAEITEQTEGEE